MVDTLELLKGTKVQHGAGLFSGTAWLAGSGEQGQRWAAQCGLWPFRQQGLDLEHYTKFSNTGLKRA